MSILTLTPPPGVYSSPQTITVTGPAGYKVQSSSDGTDPVVVHTVAGTDKFAPNIYPYIQVIDDGRGRAVFDGSFPKYFNSEWNSSTTFEGLTQGCKLLYNALNYLRGSGNRVLFLGDKGLTQTPNNGSYRIKGTANNDFLNALTGVANILGLSYTFKDPTDWPGNQIGLTYAECMQYDVIFFMSGREGIQSISTDVAANIAQARRSGVGVYICTDIGGAGIGSTERYPEAYYLNANIVVESITNANFTGSMDFSPGKTVAFNKATFGDSPLFEGMLDSEIVYASTSSFINQSALDLDNLPVSLSVGEGYTTLKFAVVDPSGNITFEQYGYNVGQPPIIELLDEQNNTIENLPPTNLRQQKVDFRYLPGSFGNASGFIKVDDTVVAEFHDVPAGKVSAEWLVTDYTLPLSPGEIFIPGDESPTLYVELYEPVVFTYEWSLNRNVPDAPSTDLSKFVQQVNTNEMATEEVSLLAPLNKALELLTMPAAAPDIRLPVLVNNIHEAWTRRIPSFALIPTPQEIKNTWPQYIMHHVLDTASNDADFIISDNVLTNTKNANCSNVLLSPYLSPSLYQYVKLSSTNQDDDWVGLLVAFKETAEYLRVYAVTFCLNETVPELLLEVMTLPPDAQPGLPNIIYSEPVQKYVLGTFPSYPAQNPTYPGWLSAGWAQGINLDVSFDGANMRVRCTSPGQPPSNDYHTNVTLTPASHPVLEGAEPRAGLFVRSQIGGRWEGYTVVRTG